MISPKGHYLMSSIHFIFWITNNDAEYKALINGMTMALKMKFMNLIALNDLELVVNQVNGGFQERGPRTELYMNYTHHLIHRFREVILECIPRERNDNADALTKMGSQKGSGCCWVSSHWKFRRFQLFLKWR